MSVLLLSGDLMVLSRVEAAAARTGIAVKAVANSAQAVVACDATPAELLIVDLASPQLDIGTLVPDIKSRNDSQTRIIAFGPHVHEEQLAAARDAGCDEVVSRGQFFAQLDTILSRLRRQVNASTAPSTAILAACGSGTLAAAASSGDGTVAPKFARHNW